MNAKTMFVCAVASSFMTYALYVITELFLHGGF